MLGFCECGNGDFYERGDNSLPAEQLSAFQEPLWG
jgi:hypothetical protein